MPPEGFSVTDLNEPPARTAVLTMELQRGVVGDLATDLETHEVRPPAIIVVGEVVAGAHPDRYTGTGARQAD